MNSKSDTPSPKPRLKREQAFIDYLEGRRLVLIAKRDALDAEIKDIDKKLLGLDALPEA